MFYMKHILDAIVSVRHIQTVIHVEDVKGDTGLSIAMRHGLNTMMTMLNEFYSITWKAAESKQPLDTPISDIPKKVYASNPRGREIVSTVQKLMDEIDEVHASQLPERGQQLERTQTQVQTVMLELSEPRRKLAVQQTKGQKLAESYEWTRKLEDALDYNTNNQTDPEREPQARERWLEERVQILEAQAEVHGQIREGLANQIEELKAMKRMHLTVSRRPKMYGLKGHKYKPAQLACVLVWQNAPHNQSTNQSDEHPLLPYKVRS
ncbi:hypothetical protein BJV82DRAFT_575527 [Fennellomyces sp. T-0311]|nr:hypothetical protein BJV82DRAFT_575527 [Fennellomyces sp. T-0311]